MKAAHSAVFSSAHCSIRASSWSRRSFARQPCYVPVSLMYVYNQMCMILLQLLLCQHERNYLGNLHFLCGNSLKKVLWKSCCCTKPHVCLCVFVSVWLYIISKGKWAVSHPGLQTEFVIQDLTSWLKEHRSPEEMVKLWPKNELKHHR